MISAQPPVVGRTLRPTRFAGRPRSGVSDLGYTQAPRTMLRDAGFASIDVHRLAHDFQNDYYIVRHAA